jgi:hypothetical protein
MMLFDVPIAAHRTIRFISIAYGRKRAALSA